jgi:hypothetical protein
VLVHPYHDEKIAHFTHEPSAGKVTCLIWLRSAYILQTYQYTQSIEDKSTPTLTLIVMYNRTIIDKPRLTARLDHLLPKIMNVNLTLPPSIQSAQTPPQPAAIPSQ